MVRQLNEDSYISRDEMGLWAVADGMGGHQAGDVASQQVTEQLGAVPTCHDIGELLHATRSAIAKANSHLIALASQFDAARSPGSTVAVLLIHDAQAAVVWAGDSRIYRLRDDEIQQITRDHSHVQELLDQHLISPEEAENHPMANVITRAVGNEDPLDLDVLHLNVLDGDCFVLCSDGLSRLLTQEEISFQMQSLAPGDAVQSMLHMALSRGASDNVTIISVQYGDKDTEDSDETRIIPRE